jgi:uncharacterized membrane protein
VETNVARQNTGSRSAVLPGPKSRTPQMGYPGVNGRQFDPSVDATAEGVAKFLGLFSIGLGTAQLFIPQHVLALIGLRSSTRRNLLIRALGARELVSGIGALTQFRPLMWIRGRVAGDMMDLALLAKAFEERDAEQKQVAIATAAVLGVTVMDILAQERLQISNPTRSVSRNDRSIHVRKSVTVNRPIEEVYGYWHNFENLARFMGHLDSVQVIDDRRSHWKAKAPLGKTIEWDAEIVNDQLPNVIAWRSVEGSEIMNSGSVHFAPAPGNRGTEVRVELRYEAPGGALGSLVAKLLGEEPAVQIGDDLKAFKQILETGDIMRSDTAIQGHRDGRPKPMQPHP